MIGGWVQAADPWSVFPVSVAAIVLAAMAGQTLGQRVRVRRGAEGALHLAPLQGALIGLLSLLIGFTFSLSAARFEARKSAVLYEANAIGAAQERAALLPAPHAAEAGRLLTEYLDVRITLGGNGAVPRSRFRRLRARFDWKTTSGKKLGPCPPRTPDPSRQVSSSKR